MTGRLLRATISGLGLAALVLVVAHLPIEPLPPGVRTPPALVASIVLVVAGIGTWGAPALAWWVLRQDPSVSALRDQIVRFVATAAGATGLAFLGALYLAGYRLVDGGGLVVLMVAVVGLYAAPYIWMLAYFIRR